MLLPPPHPPAEDVEKYKKKYKELQKVMNEYKDTVDMTSEEFLENVAKIKMNFEDYMRCIKSSLNAPKVFLKRKPNEMRINLFNGEILLAWKANLDVQIVLEPYGCASYIIGYISKSQSGMSAQLDAAAKEARKGNNSDILEMSFQTVLKWVLKKQYTLLCKFLWKKCTRDIVFINTSTPEEGIFLLKFKSVLDEFPAESTNIESDNIIQRYSKRPKQLQKFCLADYVSKVNVIYPKGNKLPEKTEENNDDDSNNESSSSDENEDSLEE